jgi:hypothetical protein
MRHLTLEELLSLQDGEELGDLARHLEQCPLCATERWALQQRREALRNLPVLQPSEDHWPAIRARILASKRRRALAFAGALAAAVLAFALFSPSLLRPRAPAVDNSVDEVAQLVRQSQRLEEQLRSLPEPEVLDVGSAETIVQLEDQIALVDECIEALTDSGASEELAVLWETRITLLESLTNLRSPAFAQLLR